MPISISNFRFWLIKLVRVHDTHNSGRIVLFYDIFYNLPFIFSDVERALSRFIAKTCGKTHSLFTTDDTNLFPLISCADTTVHAEFNTNLGADSGGDLVQVPSYVNALLFRDQIFEEYEYKPKKPKKEDDPKKKKGQKRPNEEVKKETSEPESDTEKDTSVNAGEAAENSEHEDAKVKLEDQPSTNNKPQINQFMRPARLPRSTVYSLPPVCK